MNNKEEVSRGGRLVSGLASLAVLILGLVLCYFAFTVIGEELGVKTLLILLLIPGLPLGYFGLLGLAGAITGGSDTSLPFY